MKKIQLTEFEWSVLKATMSIPLGETRTYQWIARKIGRPQAARAVGQALRKNPYPVMIPCHRVIKSDGTLGAYTGKMDGKKRRLLEIERFLVKTMGRFKLPYVRQSFGLARSRQRRTLIGGPVHPHPV